MAITVVTNAKLYADAYDISADHNKITLDWKAEAKDVTTFGNSTRVRVGGLKDISLAGSGFWQAGATPKKIDDILYGNLAVQNIPITICPLTGAAGERAFSFKSTSFDYKPAESQIGEVLKFSFTAQATGQILIPATVVQSALAALVATGNSAGQNLGAVSAAQSLYATLHVLAVSGTAPTLNAIVQSNVDNTFGAPTARITFAQATAISSQALSLAGPVTDAYYRLNYVIGGTGPSFTVAVVVGIA